MLKKINRERSKDGFTLVELVVVIAILGILSAVAVPKLSKYRKEAQLAADNATAATIYSAAQVHYTSKGDLQNFEINEYIDSNNFDDKKYNKPEIKDGKVPQISYGDGKYPDGKDSAGN